MDVVVVRTVGIGWGTLSLMGPRARDILQSVTRADLSNAAFPFGTAQVIGIAQRSTRRASGLTMLVGFWLMKFSTLSNAAPKYSS